MIATLCLCSAPAGVLMLWAGRQARMVTDQVRESNENAD